MLHTRDTAHWRALVTAAAASVECCLDEDLESYLVMVLLRYARTACPFEFRSQVELAQSADPADAEVPLEVADRCLVIAGLLADEAAVLGMPVRHFVETGRRAYQEVARRTRNPLFQRLSDHFVAIMDVLQVMRTLDEQEVAVDLISAYDQWQDTGSQYAFRLLRAATGALPSPLSSRRRH
ncbi:MAG: hypothetical protein ACT4NU_02485 [Chromatiales bacterium]